MVRLLAAGATDVGLWRTNNEDAYLVMPEAGLFALSDGDGHSGGFSYSRHSRLYRIDSMQDEEPVT